jgi:hypothetical protein
MSQASPSPPSDTVGLQPGGAVVPPPPPVSQPKNTLWQDLEQGIDYIRFVWNIAKRIRGWRNRLRFVVGLMLWKPILPLDDQNP